MIDTLDYSGRSVDLLVFQGTKPILEQKITLGFGVGGFVTSGVQKMSQTFAIHFLTELGSVPLKPDFGTEFLTAIRIGRVIDESSLQSEFVLAVQRVKRIMALTAEQETWPEDEVLDTVKLLRFNLNKLSATLAIWVELTSNAGQKHSLYLPLSVAPR